MLVHRNRVYARVGADDVGSSANTLVYIIGFGFLFYISLEYIFPALFTASARTRHAYKKMKSGEDPDRPTASVARNRFWTDDTV